MVNAEDLIGRRLLKVTTSWHHYQETEPSLLHMWLHMDGLGPVRFHTRGDGLSLEIGEPHGPTTWANAATPRSRTTCPTSP
ncbi:hypothetical protein [Streptomyces sp. PKU-MA01144]|uniref:hypothetical protein n=1 Tax=Streptomyces sp. PKU-MA01144 TaxID=2729138 RepID=UPI0020170DDE|nr:hypothetical protein [Streptomyces sp. PKU-MA01144]